MAVTVAGAMCDHRMAQCVESTPPESEGTFREKYECPCGAIGWVRGKEQEPASSWDRYGEVFE